MKTLDFADTYAPAGLSVLPIVCDGSKGPETDNLPKNDKGKPTWEPFQKQIASPEERRRLFHQNGKPVGIGIIGGKVSGNLEILDIDDPELVEPFRRLMAGIAPGLLERLPQVRTPRPGLHVYYRHTAAAVGNLKLAKTEPRPQFDKLTKRPVIIPATGLQRMAPDTLIETRGEGGYVVAPGSPPECHQTGRTYEHVAGPPLTEVPTISAEDRAVLLDAARGFNLFADEPATTSQPKGGHAGGLSPGDDFANKTTWEEILEPHAWTKVGARGDVTLWARPGKSRGISATTGLRSKAGAELLCVFSTNAWPFDVPSGKTSENYGKFSAYAFLNYQGDFSAAAKVLASKGYGEPTKGRKSREPGDEDEPFPGEPSSQYEEPQRGTKKESQAHHSWEQIEAPLYYEDFRAKYPRLPPVRIDGLQRHGEVLNLIAATKVGKSWTTYEITWRLVTGGKLWERFQCTACNVLLIDNELDPRVLSDRLARVKAALRIQDDQVHGRFAPLTLRGRLLDFDGARAYLNKHVKPGDFQYIIFDAYYRLLPAGIDENSNSDGAQIANKIDAIARDFDASVLLVHHATKGNQSGKAVTDVGSGASAMARAADTHLVLRPHEESGVIVGEAALRSFAPVDPFCMKWDFPLWKPIENLDPAKLKTAQPKATLNQIAERVFTCLRDDGPLTKNKIRQRTSTNSENVGDALDLLQERGHIEPFDVKTSNGTYPGFRVVGATPDNPGQTPDSP